MDDDASRYLREAFPCSGATGDILSGMTIRAPLATILALVALAGCAIDRHYRYTFHKAQVSQDQLLRDQATLKGAPGVVQVFSMPHHDGSGSIEVETTERREIEIQQRLTEMGYTRGEH